MRMKDWHRCKRWNDELRTACPYRGQEGHDDDEEEDQSFIGKRKRLAQSADVPVYFAYDALKRRRTEVKKVKKEVAPIPELIPFPSPKRRELPGVAASALPREVRKKGDEWILDYKTTLDQAVAAPSSRPAKVSSTTPRPVRTQSTVRSAERVAESEKALTRSLASLRHMGSAWDTGAATPPATVQGRSRGLTASAPEAKSPWQSRRAKPKKGWRTGLAIAAAALTGAGAVYLQGRRGGGGGHAQTPKFRGGPDRGAEWAIP